ncbi:hypothetical protein [Sphingomonas adhaesiva]|uniref:hypothetical protein n=1 Tax=Sphingomonas adhaesiva TaxID=28212 RepID=UPI002FF5A71D
MQTIVSTAKLFATGLATMAASLVAMAAIPHDPFVRWQAVRTEAYARLGWVYERVHADPTPTDVVLIGTSHTMNGLDGLAIARQIAADGVRAPDGRCLTVTNLSIPSYGRNMHWAVARELLRTRRPRAIVLEVFENETRKAHPLFSHVAETRDLLDAPMLLNQNYVADLIRLPYRQVQLGVESLAPREFGLKTRFDRANYDGSTVNNTRVVNVGGRALSPPMTKAMDPAELDAAAQANRDNKNLHMLPESLERYEYAVPRHYLNGILEMADKAGVPVYFLYLPGYGMPPRPYDMRLYAGRPMLEVNDLLARRDFFQDPAHLNAQGAAAVSRRVGDLMAGALRPASSATGGGGACSFGYPERATLVPFRPHHR